MAHKPILDIMSQSKKLASIMSGQSTLIQSLVDRLETSDAVVLRSVIKMMQLLLLANDHPADMIREFDLYTLMSHFAIDKMQALVHHTAVRLIEDMDRILMANPESLQNQASSI